MIGTGRIAIVWSPVDAPVNMTALTSMRPILECEQAMIFTLNMTTTQLRHWV